MSGKCDTAMFQLPSHDQFLSEDETAKLLSFSVAKLRGIRRANRIGYVAVGRAIYHSGKHISNFLRACETTAQDSPPMDSIGSASGQGQINGSEPGLIESRVRQGAKASAQQKFKPRTKSSSNGGLPTAA